MRTGRRTTRPTALLTLVVATVGLAVSTAGPAYACSCSTDIDQAEQLAQSDGAFVGVLTGIDDPLAHGPIVSSARPVVNHFRIERAVKGELGDEIGVRAAAGGASCGLEVRVGQRVGIMLEQQGGMWTSSLCAQTDPDALLTLAGPDSDVQPASNSGGDGLFVATGVVALVLFVILAVRIALGSRRR